MRPTYPSNLLAHASIDTQDCDIRSTEVENTIGRLVANGLRDIGKHEVTSIELGFCIEEISKDLSPNILRKLSQKSMAVYWRVNTCDRSES